jgi:hypothetical protein
MYSRDFLLQIIEQLGRALAAILHHREEQRYEEALGTVGDTYDELLALSPQALARLTPGSAAALLGKGAKLRIYASLLQAEAAVLSARAAPGDAVLSAALRLRALRMSLLGLQQGGRGDPALVDLARSLLSEVEPGDVDGATREGLRALGLVRPPGSRATLVPNPRPGSRAATGDPGAGRKGD